MRGEPGKDGCIMNALLDELYDYMNDDLDGQRVGQEEESGKPFSIESQEQAAWAIRKIKLIEKRRAEVIATAEAEANKIKEWVAAQDDKADRERAYFDSLLRDYMWRLREEDPKIKTLSLPGGKLQLRNQQQEYTYNEDQLTAWAKENLPEAVIIREATSKPAIKAYIKETGEVIPGVSIEDRPEKFSVEVDE